MGNSTYAIAGCADNGQPGTEKKGVWTRQQLQHIPPETIRHIPVAPVAPPAQPAVDEMAMVAMAISSTALLLRTRARKNGVVAAAG